MEFLTLCYDARTTEEDLNNLYQRSQDADKVSELRYCKDEEGNFPLHKAARHGCDVALEWIFQKWRRKKWEIDVN